MICITEWPYYKAKQLFISFIYLYAFSWKQLCRKIRGFVKFFVTTKHNCSDHSRKLELRFQFRNALDSPMNSNYNIKFKYFNPFCRKYVCVTVLYCYCTVVNSLELSTNVIQKLINTNWKLTFTGKKCWYNMVFKMNWYK